ncbi:hypothetical protein F4802DRAFT_593134 [Xylaria palmicola]|nr:hypothetical protein F4802DRAFT_593134 [Xylaria palmicola]
MKFATPIFLGLVSLAAATHNSSESGGSVFVPPFHPPFNFTGSLPGNHGNYTGEDSSAAPSGAPTGESGAASPSANAHPCKLYHPHGKGGCLPSTVPQSGAVSVSCSTGALIVAIAAAVAFST